MLLNEIKFDKTAEVEWSNPSANKHLGEFSFEGSNYQIDLNETAIDLPSGKKSVVDIAFRKNLKSSLSGDNVPFSVIGPILNALREELP